MLGCVKNNSNIFYLQLTLINNQQKGIVNIKFMLSNKIMPFNHHKNI